MIVYEEIEHTVTEECAVKAFCDVCETEIKEKVPYFDITTGHHDWGNDSHESREEYQVCSEECLQQLVDSYKSRTERRINTEYIDIKHQYMKLEEFDE